MTISPRRTLSALALALVAGGASACGGGVDISDLKDEVIDGQCAYAVRCGQAPDLASCRAGFATAGWYLAYLDSIVAAVDAGKILYDADLAATCFDLQDASTCGYANQRPEPQCKGIFKGTVADGAACLLDLECISGSCYQINCPENACCAGVCDLTGAIEAPRALGAVCVIPTTGAPQNADCVAGAYCDLDTTKCEPLRAAGATCGWNGECDYGMSCMGTPAICRVPPKTGEACVASNEGGQCDRNAWCDPASNTCRAELREGAACDPSDSLCANWLRCGASSHICEAPPSRGEACDGGYPGYSGWCAPGSYCASGTCAPLKADRASCINDDECQSGQCNDARVCAAYPVCF